jgi:hypothetical protein
MNSRNEIRDFEEIRVFELSIALVRISQHETLRKEKYDIKVSKFRLIINKSLFFAFVSLKKKYNPFFGHEKEILFMYNIIESKKY